MRRARRPPRKRYRREPRRPASDPSASGRWASGGSARRKGSRRSAPRRGGGRPSGSDGLFRRCRLGDGDLHACPAVRVTARRLAPYQLTHDRATSLIGSTDSSQRTSQEELRSPTGFLTEYGDLHTGSAIRIAPARLTPVQIHDSATSLIKRRDSSRSFACDLRISNSFLSRVTSSTFSTTPPRIASST